MHVTFFLNSIFRCLPQKKIYQTFNDSCSHFVIVVFSSWPCITGKVESLYAGKPKCAYSPFYFEILVTKDVKVSVFVVRWLSGWEYIYIYWLVTPPVVFAHGREPSHRVTKKELNLCFFSFRRHRRAKRNGTAILCEGICSRTRFMECFCVYLLHTHVLLKTWYSDMPRQLV